MHNLHYIVVQAETPEDAMSEAETMISDWGTENNWRCFGGCVSQDNEVHIHDRHSRWIPDENHTIEMINEDVRKWLQPDLYSKSIFDKVVSGNSESPFDWYGAKKYFEQMFYKTQHKHIEEFNVLTDEFYEWHFNECGVTHQYLSQQEDDDPTNKKYVVFVDMHD